MLKFNSSLKALGAATLLGLGSIAVSAPASAQSLQDVLAKVRQDSSQMSAEDQQRLREFQADTAAQSQKMADARGALAAAES
ncbi:MAG TPA: biopolymer transporter ExbB, partial [Hyphomonas sp.]|nr:biopolymer transporter ExbB [Hyphomonas sp.]